MAGRLSSGEGERGEHWETKFSFLVWADLHAGLAPWLHQLYMYLLVGKVTSKVEVVLVTSESEAG